ncbi:hypothetical protein KCU99_g299, partial [Aureobasidium melanogenum]
MNISGALLRHRTEAFLWWNSVGPITAIGRPEIDIKLGPIPGALQEVVVDYVHPVARAWKYSVGIASWSTRRCLVKSKLLMA